MRHDLRWKSAVIFIVVLFFAMLIGPLGKNIFKNDPIRLGLDLKGGIELLLTPDYRLGSSVLSKTQDELIALIKKAQINVPKVSPLGVLDGDRYDGLQFTFANADELQRAVNAGIFKEKFTLEAFGEVRNLIFEPETENNVLKLKITQDAKDFPADSLERSLEIIDRRINEASAGMAEADVRLDGKGRLNVQLPGIQTLEEAKSLITATGRLTFRINNRIVLDGTDLRDVRVNFSETNRGWVIAFEFKGNGSKQLEKITTENVGRKMAVYLDETMLMEPVIQDPIPGGSGIITLGNASKKEVEQYALLMKSGALPISLRVVQSTQVAPTLGKEVVRQCLVAGAIAILLVVAFMMVFYGIPGLMADLALIFYGILTLGVMALFRGVLTLPGIAGLILSLGMAVDANIIIFERIKDELRNGKRVRAAVEAGFNRAYITILDSNLTTLIAAGVLFFMGSGAIQGFAVTLSIGVLISMFTAIFVTKVFIEWRIDRDPDRYAKYFGIKEVVQQ